MLGSLGVFQSDAPVTWMHPREARIEGIAVAEPGPDGGTIEMNQDRASGNHGPQTKNLWRRIDQDASPKKMDAKRGRCQGEQLGVRHFQ